MKTVRDVCIQYKKKSPVKYCQKYVCAMQKKFMKNVYYILFK